MNEYAGKWYSDLFGKPTEYTLITASISEDERYGKNKSVVGEGVPRHFINCITVTRGQELDYKKMYRIQETALRLPLKSYAIEDSKSKHRVFKYLFLHADKMTFGPMFKEPVTVSGLFDFPKVVGVRDY